MHCDHCSYPISPANSAGLSKCPRCGYRPALAYKKRPVTVELTDDEAETVRLLIEDWGFEYSLKAHRSKVRALARKVGMDANQVTLLLGDEEPQL